MALLTDQQRAEVWADIMQKISQLWEPCLISKTDLRAAINAVDSWAESNKTSYNTAIPQPARNNLTASQKAALLMYVTARRYKENV